MCSMCLANLKKIRSKISECLTTRALAHASSHTLALAHMRAVREHDKYVAHVNYGACSIMPVREIQNTSDNVLYNGMVRSSQNSVRGLSIFRNPNIPVQILLGTTTAFYVS
jgi:hypothetical protein